MAAAGDILGEFELRREIGRGAMGVVWEAHQPSLDRIVALKVLKDAAEDPTWVQRFRAEAGQAAKLSHRGILPIYAFGQTGNDYWYAMELVDGDDLSERLARDKQIPPRIATGWIRDAARALHHAHEHGVVHRDVKPANIMVQPDGRVVVTDFGLSKGMGNAGLTKTGMLIGTPYYMSPEMVSGDGEPGPSADIYALGVTLYELVDGQPPFLADSAVALIRMIADVDPPPLRPRGSIVGDALVELERIAHRAMAKRPEDRYATAAEMADELDAVLDDASQPLRASATQVASPQPRSRWIPWVVGGVILALAGVAAFLAIAAKDQRDSLEARDEAMKDLEAKIATLIEKDDIEGAQEVLDAHAKAVGNAAPKGDKPTVFQKLGGKVILATLASGLAGGAKMRRDVKTWPDKTATMTLSVVPPEAKLEAVNLAASLKPQAVKASSDATWEAGIWRIVAQAPGRMRTVATIVLSPTSKGTVSLTLPAAPRDDDAVFFPGLWVPARKGDDAPLHSVVDPFTLSAGAVTPEAYLAFVQDTPKDERADMAPPTSPHNKPGLPVRVFARQAKAFARAANARLPFDVEFRTAIMPAYLAMLHRERGKELQLRNDLRALLQREGRRDFDATDPRFWIQTPKGATRAESVRGFEGASRRGRGKRGAPRVPRSTTNQGLVLLARSP